MGDLYIAISYEHVFSVFSFLVFQALFQFPFLLPLDYAQSLSQFFEALFYEILHTIHTKL